MSYIFKTLLVKGAKGDRGEAGQAEAVATGSVVGWSGGTIPSGYESTSAPTSWIKKVATTPLTTIAKVVDSLANTANVSVNAPSIRAVNAKFSEVDNNLANMWEVIYPVGAIYISTNSASPASLFGGTWSAINERFLLASGSSHSAGSTGGAFNKNISVSGTTNEHALTINELPAHKHVVPEIHGKTDKTGSGHTHTYYLTSYTPSNATEGEEGGVSDMEWKAWQTGNQEGTGLNEGEHTHTFTIEEVETSDIGGGAGHTHSFSGSGSNDITPPYLSVYMWQRTA